MATANLREIEAHDADRVDEALKALVTRDIKFAEPILLSVIENTPTGYSNSSENDDGSISIRFWDRHELVHYVTWQRQREIGRDVQWIGNAYPRAQFYMGFLRVQNRQYAQAIEYLAQGQQLEPTNPKFKLEIAQALIHSGKREKALALYDEVQEIGPHVSGRDIAVARRGRGFILVEMGQLDKAEAAFNSSLEIEPSSEIALNELRHIEDLRRGGNATFGEAIPTRGLSLSHCATCGEKFKDGVAVSVKGMQTIICKTCEGKLRRKWWQFW